MLKVMKQRQAEVGVEPCFLPYVSGTTLGTQVPLAKTSVAPQPPSDTSILTPLKVSRLPALRRCLSRLLGCTSSQRTRHSSEASSFSSCIFLGHEAYT